MCRVKIPGYPYAALGVAIRALGETPPSSDWIRGFEAGYGVGTPCARDKLQADITALRFMLDLEWKAINGDTPSPNWVPYARGLQEAAEKIAAKS